MANRSRRLMPHHDADSRVPRYLQVASALRRRLRDGRWAVGDKIATLEELEREFDVARVTVRQAIELLQSEGLLKSHQGRGTFVTKTVEHDRWLQLATDWASLIEPIRDHVPQLLPADPDTSALIEPRIEEDDGIAAPAYVAIRSIQKRDGKPYAYARVHVARHIHARAAKAFASRVALAVLSETKGLAIARARQTVVVGAADVDTAQHLGIALNSPTAEARCVVTDTDGVVIYVGEITYPGDYVRLNIELIP
jgi:GntR family transcriptional regulator